MRISSALRAGLLVTVLAVAACSTSNPTADAGDFQLPLGFEISLYADHTLAHDIYKMTFDPRGRLVVSGPDYVKILQDSDGDGRADRVIEVSDFPSEGARGLYVDGEDLIAVGDQGVWRMVSYEERGFDESARILLLAHEGRGDHNANSILKGPDGWFYLVTGDNAGIGPGHASLEGSPVRRPIQGALLRIAPNGAGSQVLAHGFRNPYDIAFNSYGHLFTYDADGERVQYLPWYVPTRAYDVAQGMLHGWIFFGLQYWNPPGYFFDHAERLVETGRGSPTAVLVYRHRRFPVRYHDGLFLADWSYGRLYFLPLRREGSGYRPKPEIFLQVSGERGFAVTAAEVGPEGDLFVSIGGRGTRGEVYRIRYNGRTPAEPPTVDPLRRVLGADQPLSSWSRARWVPEAERLGRAAFEEAVTDRTLSVRERIRSLEVMVELFGEVPVETVLDVVSRPGTEATLAARALWALSLHGSTSSTGEEGRRLRTALAEATRTDDPLIARHAWEALGRLPFLEDRLDRNPDWLRAFDSEDRRVRAAAFTVARGLGYDNFVRNVEPARLSTPRRRLGFLYVQGPDFLDTAEGRSEMLLQATEIFERTDDHATRLDALRLLQIGLGDILLTPGEPGVDDGYRGADVDQVDEPLREQLARRLGARFPSGDSTVDFELARLTAMLETAPEGFLETLSEMWTETSTVEDDIHYLLVSMRLPGERTAEVTRRTSRALVALHLKMNEGGYPPSRFWPGRVAALFERLMERDPALAAAVVDRPEFRLAEHAVPARVLPEPHRTEAARRLLAAALERESKGERALTSELVELVSTLSSKELVSVLRRHLDDPGLTDAVLPVLADHAEPGDLDSFLDALQSRRGRTVRTAVRGLLRITHRPTPEQWIVALRALELHAGSSDPDEVVADLSRLLAWWAGDARSVPTPDAEPKDVYQEWLDWFSGHLPDAAAELRAGARSEEAFEEQLARVDWKEGSVESGRRLFSRLGCETCHAGPTRLGPRLEGLTRRFGPEDLLRIVNDPERVRWSAYQTTRIVTADGRAHSGILIYDSPAVRLLQMRDGETLHLRGDEVVEIQVGDESLMPSGLLRGLTHRDLADLFAYLATL